MIRLIKRLKPLGEIFLYLDQKNNKFDKIQKLQETYGFHLVLPRVRVFWGGFSMVEATLGLMEFTAERGASRLCLLSESCCPIVDDND